MGVDVTGWIEYVPWLEYKPEYGEEWQPAIALHVLHQGRSYDSFGCLFGVKNYAHFRPIAADRGLPENVSKQVRQDSERYGTEGFGHSWISWAELKAVDWDEEAEEADSRIHWYTRGEDGHLEYGGKAAWDRDFAEHVGHGMIEGIFGTRVWPDGQEWEINGKVYRAEKLTRKDAMDGNWSAVFSVMEILARLYGDANVRLVVWFYA